MFSYAGPWSGLKQKLHLLSSHLRQAEVENYCLISTAASAEQQDLCPTLGITKRMWRGSLLMGLSGQKLLRYSPKHLRTWKGLASLSRKKQRQNLPNSCTCNEMKQMHQQVFISFLSYVSFSESWMVFYEAQHSWDSWDVSRPLCRGEFGHSDLSKVRKSWPG